MTVALMCQREEITWGHVLTWQKDRNEPRAWTKSQRTWGMENHAKEKKKKKRGSFDPRAFVTSFVVEFSYFLLFPWGQMKLCERKTACSFFAKWPCWSCRDVLQKYFIHPETLTRKPSLIDESLISHSLSPCKKKKNANYMLENNMAIINHITHYHHLTDTWWIETLQGEKQFAYLPNFSGSSRNLLQLIFHWGKGNSICCWTATICQFHEWEMLWVKEIFKGHI